MTSIVDIEGIGAKWADKLAEAGIRTTEKLLEVAGPKAGRVALASQVGASEATVLEWVNRADLMRIKGVGEEYSDLLEAVGVEVVFADTLFHIVAQAFAHAGKAALLVGCELRQ